MPCIWWCRMWVHLLLYCLLCFSIRQKSYLCLAPLLHGIAKCWRRCRMHVADILWFSQFCYWKDWPPAGVSKLPSNWKTAPLQTASWGPFIGIWKTMLTMMTLCSWKRMSRLLQQIFRCRVFRAMCTVHRQSLLLLSFGFFITACAVRVCVFWVE